MLGWKGGNTKNKAGEGEMVLILGDYLGPQGVGEGENCVYFTDEEALVLVLRGGLCVYSQKGEVGKMT